MTSKFEMKKIFAKLPLYKLSARMAYCLAFDMLLLLFTMTLHVWGKRIDTFPNAWDFRFMLLTTIVVFFVGISDMFRDP